MRPWRMWVALLGGALAWTGHLLLAYAIAEFGCASGWGHRSFIQISAVSWLLIAMSVGMIAAAVWAVVVSRRISQASGSASPDPDEWATADYVGRFGLIANWLFLFIIVVECMPIFFFLGRC